MLSTMLNQDFLSLPDVEQRDLILTIRSTRTKRLTPAPKRRKPVGTTTPRAPSVPRKQRKKVDSLIDRLAQLSPEELAQLQKEFI